MTLDGSPLHQSNGYNYGRTNETETPQSSILRHDHCQRHTFPNHIDVTFWYPLIWPPSPTGVRAPRSLNSRPPTFLGQQPTPSFPDYSPRAPLLQTPARYNERHWVALRAWLHSESRAETREAKHNIHLKANAINFAAHATPQRVPDTISNAPIECTCMARCFPSNYS